ncbi:acyltransferase family protein [Cryobacterium luteum]|uniref:Acyltransferase n=1 Tax=Cryobacterium luteum TaxID=1424661 RepID=A0A1H8G6E3_9MICO|nr:acyltransferase family protein [Cryobacterium luteum]TFB93882.1 acyltransferase [Cryobacterium luteum]SEN39691.1 Peptidoglycan/LPS O-acetylase OafA/YrhL, contains acyltransferase and SGNH-hydrolase domains [Cryobacterium luteum]
MSVQSVLERHERAPDPAGPTRGKSATRTFRGDIEGLRAVAVIVVILDHLLGWPSGGFIGVDIFFVISGFLITSLLLKEHARTGRISLVDFYRRRIRRILPVSLLVLVVTVAVGYLLLPGARALSTLWDGIYSALFVANWHFAFVGTDYLQATNAVSPLQHYWSLAVEEQFYFVWPFLLIVIFALTGRRTLSARALVTMVAVTTGVITVAFLAWSFFETSTSPAIAYFSTGARAWELGIGALLAAAAPGIAKLSAAVRPVLAWLGLALIVASLVLISRDSPFPAPWGLLPVAGSALVIAAGIGRPEQRLLFPLTNPVSRYIGKISYSLYLWHFPVAILLATVFATDSPVYLPLAFGLMLALSVFSFHFVEDPIRHSLWLENSQTRQRERMRRPATRHRPGLTAAQGWIGALVVVTLVIVSVSFVALKGGASSGPAAGPAALGADANLGIETPAEPATLLAARQAAITAALAATAWPETTPAFDALGDNSGAPEWIDDNCLSVSAKNAAGCRYGDPAATKTAVLLGDSMAISYMPAIRAALEPLGYNVHSLTMFSCPAVNISVAPKNASDASAATCDDHHAWVYAEVARLSPDLVIMSSLAGSIVRLASGNEGAVALTEWQTATADTITALQGSTEHVAVLSPPPASTPFAECKTLTSNPADCAYSPSSLYQKVVAAEQSAVEGHGDFAQYVNVVPWLCVDSSCPAVIDNTPVFFDGQHFVREASTQLGPLLAEALFPPAA